MLITLSGDSYGFFDNAFYNLDTDDFDVDLVSASSSRVVVENPSTGAVTAFVGSGLVASSNDDDIRGTLSALEFYDADGDLVAQHDRYQLGAARSDRGAGRCAHRMGTTTR